MYTGRFAPTPSGRLHFGSVVALMGSYLRARSLNGRFILRIEDIDTTRCRDGMGDVVVSEINSLGFDHDGDILVQSKNIPFYVSVIKRLIESSEAFFCACTRKSLKEHPCECYLNQDNLSVKSGTSVRFKPSFKIDEHFDDVLLGRIDVKDYGDYLPLRRSDGLYSYNLACVADDIEAGVTEVVRGQDLIDVTPKQKALYRALDAKVPDYLHLPLALESEQLKFSKQNHARAILDELPPHKILINALRFLGQDTDYLEGITNTKVILLKAVDNFDLSKIPHQSCVVSENGFSVPSHSMV